MTMPALGYASAFIAEPNQCWRVVHGYGGQATHSSVRA
jgi:hypothetical protein